LESEEPAILQRQEQPHINEVLSDTFQAA
jgi:hypothetical protein